MAATVSSLDQHQPRCVDDGLGCQVSHVHQDQVHELISRLGDLALSCYGPAGRSKAVGATQDTPAGIITSTSSRLFTGFHVRHPYLNLLLQATASAQQQQYGDGGLLAVHLACRLIAHGLQGATSQSGRAALCRAYRRCADHVAGLLGQHLSAGPSTRVGGRHVKQSRTGGRQRDVVRHDQGHGHDQGYGQVMSGGAARGQGLCSGGSASKAQGHHLAVNSDCNNDSADSYESNSDDSSHSSDSDSRDNEFECVGSRDVSKATIPSNSPGYTQVALRLDVRDARAKGYLALAKGVLGSKQATGLSSEEQEVVAVLLVRAFVSSLAARQDEDTSTAVHHTANPPLPQLMVQAGLGREAWQLIDGVLVSSPVRPRVVPLLPLGPCLVALFQVPLEPGWARAEAGAGQEPEGPPLCMESRDTGDAWSPAAADLELLLQLLGQLKSAGVKLLACQKGIHEEVAQAAVTLGMLPIARLSAPVATQLAATTGALPLTSTRHLLTSPATAEAGTQQCRSTTGQGWSRWLGVCGGVQLKKLGTKQVLHILPTHPGHGATTAHLTAQAPACAGRCRPAQALVLGAASDTTCDELKAAATAVLRVLHTTWRVPWVLPGGGATEALLAEHVRECMMRDRRRGKLTAAQVAAYEVFAGGLESAACQLLDATGFSQQEVVDAVRSTTHPALPTLYGPHHQQHPPAAPLDLLGWLHDTQQFTCVAQMQPVQQSGPDGPRSTLANPVLLDSLPVKLSAVLRAVEAACMLLKVDTLLLCDV